MLSSKYSYDAYAGGLPTYIEQIKPTAMPFIEVYGMNRFEVEINRRPNKSQML